MLFVSTNAGKRHARKHAHSPPQKTCARRKVLQPSIWRAFHEKRHDVQAENISLSSTFSRRKLYFQQKESNGCFLASILLRRISFRERRPLSAHISASQVASAVRSFPFAILHQPRNENPNRISSRRHPAEADTLLRELNIASTRRAQAVLARTMTLTTKPFHAILSYYFFQSILLALVPRARRTSLSLNRRSGDFVCA